MPPMARASAARPAPTASAKPVGGTVSFNFGANNKGWNGTATGTVPVFLGVKGTGTITSGAKWGQPAVTTVTKGLTL